MATSKSSLDQTLAALADQPAIGYMPGSAVAAEPTAIAALALFAHGQREAAQIAGEALIKLQGEQGNVGVRAGETVTGWPTSLAIVAWQRTDAVRYRHNIQRAVAWLVGHQGLAIERNAEFGHDTTLVGWAYAEGTHSWVEPTSFAVLALKAVDQADSPPAREGVAMLLDRQLPGGGLNYGNTFVLGQLIRPHVQPTGLALLALAGKQDSSGRIAKSVAWLSRSIGPETTPLSLGWAALGLKAQGVELPAVAAWLSAAAARVQSRDQSLHKRALLALAAKGWSE